MNPVRMAHSPCPNDTFAFHAWAHGLVAGAPPLEVTFADIDRTNTWLTDDAFDVMKISFAAVPHAIEEGWQLLPAGGAVGRGCGPLLLTRDDAFETASAEWLAGRRVAVPSEMSTAYLLFRLWAAERVPAPGVEIEVIRFDEIMPAVAGGRVDAGLVIHEARFTYATYALSAMLDLGEWWELHTGLAIPLGAIVARPRPGGPTIDELTEWTRASVAAAWSDPTASRPYVEAHAQEMEAAVQRQHIELYVNDMTHDLGTEGWAAVRGLLGRAAAAGLVPRVHL